MEQSPWETSICAVSQISSGFFYWNFLSFVFCTMCATCSAHHTLLDFCHPNNIGQRLQLLKFLIMEFLSSHVTSSYAQIFYPQPCQAGWLVTYIWKVPYLNLRQDIWLSWLTVLTWVFLDWLSLKREAPKYIIMLGTTHTHMTEHLFPEELNLQMPCFQQNSQKDSSYSYLIHSISCPTLLTFF